MIDQDGEETLYDTLTPGEMIEMEMDTLKHGEVKASQAFEKEIKDSGARTEFQTGAVRDAQGGKGRFDLLPKMTIWALAKHYEKGCQKYGDRNWEKGIPIQNYMDSAQRHLTKFELGFTDENHLMSALWNIACAYETLLRIKLGVLPNELDNLPYPLKDQNIDGEVLDTWLMHYNFHNDNEEDVS